MDINKLYEYYIVLFYYKNYKDISLLKDKNYDLYKIYNYINEFYYKNFDEYLDISLEENRKNLYTFLNSIFRYNLLNDNLYEAYDYLKDYKDGYIINNFDFLSSIVLDECKHFEEYDAKNISYDLVLLSHEELDNLFKKFLNNIDPSGNYLKIYIKMKENNKIIYLDLLDEFEKDKLKKLLNINGNNYNDFFVRNDNIGSYIILDRKGTIEDFSKLAHEFTHYVTYLNDNTNKEHILLEEFPSMFNELLSNIFLIEEGYSKENVEKVVIDRFKYIYNLSTYASVTNQFLEIYMENNNTIDEQLIKNKMIDGNIINPDSVVGEFVDFVNYFLTADPTSILGTYPYILGNYLSKAYIEEYGKNKNILKLMKDITMNLSNYDVEKIKSKIKK